MCEAVFGEECKMQQDSINFSSSGHMTENQVIPQESTIKSFQCCHCPLLFKSKVYLFEHLNTVHGFDVDAALKEAGLKYPGNNKANTDNNCTRSGDDFQCQHCDFIACSWDVLNDHDKQCHKKLEDQNVIGNLNPGAKITVISTNQHSGAAGAKETTPSFSVMSTSNSKYAIVSSKDLKTYKRPLQTITKYFVATSGPNVKPAVKLADSSELPDSTKGTIILQESPSSSSPNSSGVFKVTAKSLIDITHVSQRFLLDDHLLNTDLRPPKPKEQSKETVPSNAGKRTNNESSKSPPAKKAKSDNETKPPEEASASKQQPSSNTEISFDFSEDEGEKKLPFTTDVLKALKKHYKKNHLIHAVDNSLMYCRYSATGCHEGSSQSNKCEKALGPERRGGISPESACSSNKEVKNPPSPQHPISPGADVGFYHCNTCKFSHKSVVVMHVHYQKSHPGKEVTMDKIKSAHVTSHRTSQKIPDKTPNPVAITGTSAHQMNISDTFKKTKDKAELSQRKHAAEDSKTHSESPKTMKAESAEDGNKGKRSPSKRMRERESLTRISPIKLFYCQFCSYSSTNIKSVVGHHNAKHAVHALTCIEEILSYSAEVQKNKLQSEAEASPSTKSSNTKTNKQVKVYSEKVQHEEENVYACAENLFYCQKCNYGNPSVKGVANHHCKIHRSLHYSRERTLEHTALIRDEIEKSKSQAKDFPFSTRLPLPLINEGDEDMFFCHFCNYRQCTKEYVLRHYVKRHRGFMVTGEQVCLYTSVVREKTQKSHLKTTANQEVDHFKVKENKKAEKLGKSVSVSAAPSVTPSQTQRTLQCYRCAYSTQYVCVLKRHIWKVHRANRTVSNVLRKCYKQGSLQTGYHCDMCVFSHKDAAVVYEHYHEQHPGRKPSLDYVTNQLYVGPKLPKRKKPQINHSDDTDGRSPSQKPGQNESKTYSCRACSFKGSSLSILARHYRDVHPWSVKEDGSVLGVVKNKRPSASRLVEDHNKLSGSFETYQVPLEFDDSPGLSPEETASSEMLTCPNCPSKFYTQHGLNTHCGMKHHEAVNENAEEPQEQIQTRMYVFKCPHCSYVNTNYQGVLTHCQMMHPALESRADNFHLDEAHLSNWDDCLKRKGPGNPGNLKISGYMCLDCPHICSTLEKLKKHCEKEHTETPTPSAVSKLKQYRTLSNRLPVSQVSFLSKKVYAVVRCQFCAYCCSTKLALGRHMLVHHRKAPAAKVQESVFKCILCSNSYFTKKRLRSHYFNKHGRDSFLEYFAPVYKKADEKPEPTSHDPLTRQQENTGEAFESSTTAEQTKKMVYRCPTCPYVNASYHGTLTHCQMKHPDIIARADELQTDVVLVNNMVGCTIGSGFNERGYICKMCPQIFASLRKLKVHHVTDHDGAEPRASERPDHGSHGSELMDLKNNAAVSATEMGFSRDLDTPKTCESSIPYKCHMCSYKAYYRRYLQCHYKNTHKLDAPVTRKLLENYGKYKLNNASQLPGAECEEGATLTCKKCPELMFESTQLLVAHYATCHSSKCIDFTVLSQGSKKGSTGLYRCVHCNKQMNGIRKLWYHLDCHRERDIKRANAAMTTASPVITTTPEAKSVKLGRQDELLMLESVEELSQWNVAPVQTFTLPLSPLSSPSNPADEEQPQLKSREHTCRQCRRTFMSLKGLRSHERSHAAVAAIKKLDNLPTSVLKHDINKYVLYKIGTIKPFLCSFCSYRTTVMGLWRSHFMKTHKDDIADPDETDNQDEQRADKEPLSSSEELNYCIEPEITEKSLYLEPPDVQRQLNHYSFMAQADALTKTNRQESTLPDDCLLHCEFCNFNTGHLSSMRRHYLNRHGKKIFRCKDCSFFSGLRKTLEMHMKTGHSTCQSEPSHQKDLRCPFCLYQTKNKNNMIDHIVLHREERVVPIEIRRSKLSRCLQGIVFRCHKCTFTSGSSENLRMHMTKHDDIKPYKCRLCYFDCTRLSDLEAHLSDKHQVVRNHELVGQVSLHQLQARVGTMPEQEEEPSSNFEQHNNDSEDVETDEFVTDCNEAPHKTQAKDPAENPTREDITLQTEEAGPKQWEDGKYKKSSAKSFVSVLQYENVKPNQEKHVQDPQERAVVFLLAQPKLRDNEDSSNTFRKQKDAEAEGSSTTCVKIAEKAQAPNPHDKASQHKRLDINAWVEENTLHHIHKTHMNADPDTRFKTEKNMETEVVDDVRSEMVLLDEEGSIPLAHEPEHLVNKEAISALSILLPKCAQLKLSHKESSAVSLPNCNNEQVYKKIAEVRDPYEDMPVLEKEYLKEEMQPLGCKEKDQSHHLEQKQDKEDEMITEDDENRCTNQKHEESDGRKEAANPLAPEDALTVLDGAAEVLSPAATEEKPFTCEFCGRNLMNSSELERHVMRHRI